MTKRIAAVLALLAACGDNFATEDVAATCERGAMHACGAWLRDGDGRAVVLRGVNLAGAHKTAPYTDDFTHADYARLHAWGFRSVRFLLTWAAIEPTQGTYDDAHLAWVRERMQWARAAGLDVVLDMHQDVYGDGFGFDGAPRWTCDEAYYAAFVPRDNWILNYSDPNVLACYDHLWTDDALQAAFAAMWGHVAEVLADEPAIIGFDILNEPHWGTAPVPEFERARLQPAYTRVIAAVRAHAPGWIAFAEPAASRNLGLATKLDVFAEPDVVYAPHMYDPSAELSGEFDAARRDALLATAEDLAADARGLGLPLWIGEYGGVGESPQIGAYMDAAYDGTAAAFAGSTYWAMDRGPGYALLDADGHEKPALFDAVARPYPARVAGEPLAWTYDDATRTLEVSWRPDATITAPTVIVTPAWTYPTGVTVDCDGCTVVTRDGEVEVTGGASVTVRPGS